MVWSMLIHVHIIPHATLQSFAPPWLWTWSWSSHGCNWEAGYVYDVEHRAVSSDASRLDGGQSDASCLCFDDERRATTEFSRRRDARWGALGSAQRRDGGRRSTTLDAHCVLTTGKVSWVVCELFSKIMSSFQSNLRRFPSKYIFKYSINVFYNLF